MAPMISDKSKENKVYNMDDQKKKKKKNTNVEPENGLWGTKIGLKKRSKDWFGFSHSNYMT